MSNLQTQRCRDDKYSLSSSFPKLAGTYKPPRVMYKFNETIHSKIFNFNQFVKELDIEAFLKDENFSVNVKEFRF